MAETVGTFLLLLSVVGAGLMAQRLATGSPLLGLAMSAAVIAGMLVSMIVALRVVSGGHFNPLITALQCLSGERSLGCAVAYIAAQMLGGIVAAGVAAPLLGHPAAPSPQPAASLALVASEAIATTGLMVVVFGCSRSGRTETGPFAVGAWLASAIMATPSRSYASPAVTLAAIVAAGPVHLSAIRAVSFVLAEIGGALPRAASVRRRGGPGRRFSSREASARCRRQSALGGNSATW